MRKTVRILIPFILFSLLLAGCTVDNPSPDPTDPRDSFIGNWSVNETGVKLSYEVSIVADDSSSNKVYIYNFANAGATSVPAIAVVSGNSITLVSNQVIGDGWVINGGGSLGSTGMINWLYTLVDGATQYNLSAVYSRL